MDIEFHYYITYILAREAGFLKDEAGTLAYACQYTDDNCYQYYVNLHRGDEEYYLSRVSQTMDITKPSVKQQRIYPFFHFFPGDPASPTTAREDGATHRFNTTPDSENVRYVFQKALESNDLYRIGIAAHVYADSWAHQNFVGFEDKFNAMGSITPNIGHADAFHNPDEVHHTWSDDRLVNANQSIDNNARFLEAAQQIYGAFRKYKDPAVSDKAIAASWDNLGGKLNHAMTAGSAFKVDQKVRVEHYMTLAPDMPEYDEKEWRHNALDKREWEADLFDRYWAKDDFFESPWYRFQEAVKEHTKVSKETLAVLYGG